MFSFAGLERLLVLDLNYVGAEALASSSPDVFAPLGALRRLSMDGCCLDCAPASLAPLSSLEALSLSENEIESAAALAGLAVVGRTLLELDLRENEGLSGHEGEVRRFCPSLKTLDNKNLKMEGAGKRLDQLKLGPGAAAA